MIITFFSESSSKTKKIPSIFQSASLFNYHESSPQSLRISSIKQSLFRENFPQLGFSYPLSRVFFPETEQEGPCFHMFSIKVESDVIDTYPISSLVFPAGYLISEKKKFRKALFLRGSGNYGMEME